MPKKMPVFFQKDNSAIILSHFYFKLNKKKP